jgi:peptidyl-prolyl cis-trans isomerase A (cyclophilin A)
MRGSVAMARTMVPDSATAQFFINLKDNEFLNADKARDGNGYAVFGKVVSGMDVVDKIRNVKTGDKGPHQNVPLEPVMIKKATVVAEK